jgi:hypothetical protein
MRLPQISDEHDTKLDALQNKTPKNRSHQALRRDFASKSAPMPALGPFFGLFHSYCRPRRP